MKDKRKAKRLEREAKKLQLLNRELGSCIGTPFPSYRSLILVRHDVTGAAANPIYLRCTVGRYSEEHNEGPAHRSPHSPSRLLATLNPEATTIYENFRYTSLPF